MNNQLARETVNAWLIKVGASVPGDKLTNLEYANRLREMVGDDKAQLGPFTERENACTYLRNCAINIRLVGTPRPTKEGLPVRVRADMGMLPTKLPTNTASRMTDGEYRSIESAPADGTQILASMGSGPEPTRWVLVFPPDRDPEPLRPGWFNERTQRRWQPLVWKPVREKATA